DLHPGGSAGPERSGGWLRPAILFRDGKARSADGKSSASAIAGRAGLPADRPLEGLAAGFSDVGGHQSAV
ncbi:hypothetical protein, partial [Xanthobacter autotrophicus]|uniref:hypothetical protein n=1 Tax=Xanthobacter autotrophicus TaxID=280 RepID=UPI0037269C89